MIHFIRLVNFEHWNLFISYSVFKFSFFVILELMIIHWVHSPIRCLHPQWHQKSQLCGERNQKLPLNLCLILSDTKICCWTNTNQPIEVCFREWQCKEKSHYVWIIYGWSMLKHSFFCRIWRYISCIVRRGETRYLPQYLQDLRHTCTWQLDVNL